MKRSEETSANNRQKGDEAPTLSETDPRASPTTLHPNNETSSQHGRDIADGASATHPGTAVALTSTDIRLDKLISQLAEMQLNHVREISKIEDKMEAKHAREISKMEEKHARDISRMEANQEKQDANFEKVAAHQGKMDAIIVAASQNGLAARP